MLPRSARNMGNDKRAVMSQVFRILREVKEKDPSQKPAASLPTSVHSDHLLKHRHTRLMILEKRAGLAVILRKYVVVYYNSLSMYVCASTLFPYSALNRNSKES